jgi:hypothetical protein
VKLLSSVWYWLTDGYWPSAERDGDAPDGAPPLLACGDVTDLRLATWEDGLPDTPEADYLLKIARGPEGASHLDAERSALAKLLRAAGESTYRRYLPDLVRSLRAADRVAKPVNVFRFEPGFHTLEQVHEQHPALDGRHLAWVLNRLLTVLGFCHRQNVVHGAVLPCHALVDARSHGLRLVGWGQSVAAGRPLRGVPARYRDWYPAEVRSRQPAGPATDLFLAARCVVYLAGGDPLTGRMPESVPAPMRRFLGTCLLESPRMRPGDAWALLEDFAGLLRALYGPPEFHELTLT